MSVFVAMLAATIGVCLTPMPGFWLASPILVPIGFIVGFILRKISPWNEDDEFDPRNMFLMRAGVGAASAICVAGALICANYLASNRLPAWPVPVVPAVAAFAGAFVVPLVPHPLVLVILLIGSAILAIPAAGIAAYVWG
jgi:hypothetical protein